jgi:hypothetical protein
VPPAARGDLSHEASVTELLGELGSRRAIGIDN